MKGIYGPGLGGAEIAEAIDFDENERRQTPYGSLWLIFFVVVLGGSLVGHLMVLPRFFPHLQAGDGVLLGGEWVFLHHMAGELAEVIRTEGWSAWVLRPGGQWSTGVTAAVYALTRTRPWTILPLNAALHATSVVVLLMIVQRLLPDWRKAMWAVFPFFCFPSVLLRVVTMYHDGLFVTGFFCFVLGWVVLGTGNGGRRGWAGSLVGLGLIAGGGVLAWVDRPEMTASFLGLGLIMAGVLSVLLIVGKGKGLKANGFLPGILLAWLAVLALGLLVWQELPGESFREEMMSQDRVDLAWERSPRWPEVIDEGLHSIALTREGYYDRNPGLGHLIDEDVHFRRVSDLVRYVPRAFQVALFYPFPRYWLNKGARKSNTLLLRFSGIETGVVYAGLAGVLLALVFWRRRIVLWLVVLCSLGTMLPFVLAIPDGGSLYQMRFGPLMLLVALGYAGMKRWLMRRD